MKLILLPKTFFIHLFVFDVFIKKNIHYIQKSDNILWNLKSKFIFKTPVDIANDFGHEKIVQILENELER